MDLKLYFFFIFLVQSLTNSVYSLTLTDETGLGGFWITRSEASLLCTNSPYTGIHIWKLGSNVVSRCTRRTCETISKRDDFLFGNDVQSGIFRWTFLEVSEKYNGKVLRCSDGTETLRHTVKVKDCECDGCRRCVWFCGVAVFVLVAQIIVLLLNIFDVRFQRRLERFKTTFLARDAILVVYGFGVGLIGIFVWNDYCPSCQDCAKCTGFSICSTVLAIVSTYISYRIASYRLANEQAAQ